ncbi:MAG: hypothetical protein ACR2LM_08570 [Pyrinomonadaceae bacterium]
MNSVETAKPSIRTEALAGTTAFFTMSYIGVVLIHGTYAHDR